VAGADANPYLVLAAILGAALEGIEGRITPPAPLASTPAGSGASLPLDWLDAIDAFAASAPLARVFDASLRETFLGMKRQELQVFSKQISAFEHETYLETV
jgi:glutamine synthetase